MLMELVATRRIKMGEEATIIYGQAWQDAWTEYVQKWVPLTTDEHVWANDNMIKVTTVRTESEQEAANILLPRRKLAF